MRSFALEIVDGHPVVAFPGGLAVIDTGSPLTMTAPHVVSEALGRPVARLIGTDQLRRSRILLDYAGGRYVEDCAEIPGETFPLESTMGVYRISLEHRGETHMAFLDTGAKLSYADSAAIVGLVPVGKATDFYPGLGSFEVDVYELAVTVGSRVINGKFGVLPDLLKLALSLAGLDGWILGSDFFIGRQIVLDLANDRVIDVTESANALAFVSDGGGTSSYASKSKMNRAYGAAHLLVNAELTHDDRAIIAALTDRSVIVVKGGYDRVEDVLRLARIPHTVVQPADLAATVLSPEQLVVINCPGNIEDAGLEALRVFVETGGSLVTTDWALKNVIEKAFPGFVAYNRSATGDEVVRIEIRDASNPWLAGMFAEGADPLWWLEGSSYPIRILDPERVNVLLASAELGERYGETPVAVSFDVGKGDVLHMISHYYLQRAELRTARHAKSWKAYANEMGAGRVADEAPKAYEDLNVSEVEAAHKSLRFMTNMVLQKQRKNRSV